MRRKLLRPRLRKLLPRKRLLRPNRRKLAPSRRRLISKLKRRSLMPRKPVVREPVKLLKTPKKQKLRLKPRSKSRRKKLREKK